MCYTCWEEAGRPRIDSHWVATAWQAVERATNAGGTRLHIVVDDWNIEDHHIRACIDAPDDPHETPEQKKAAIEAAEALLRCSLAERASALALHEGFWSVWDG